jgi:hypothetical protein
MSNKSFEVVLTVCNGWSSSSFTVWPSTWNLVHGWCVKYVVWWNARYGHGGEAYKSRYMETLCWDHVYITHTHTHSLSLSLSLSKPSNSINQLQDTLCHLLVGALMKYISSMFETHLSLFPPQFSIWQILLLFVGIDCLRGVSCMWKHSLIFSLPLWKMWGCWWRTSWVLFPLLCENMSEWELRENFEFRV